MLKNAECTSDLKEIYNTFRGESMRTNETADMEL